ncbi:hypothetical protein [Nonomuraea jabiensis]|uniref:hypothetical protein n=1 Tax=Nonomuraea jabiensis TaxID=882448 RepID=UPI003D74B02C
MTGSCPGSCLATIFDILHLITGGSGFPIAAAYAMAAGIIGGQRRGGAVTGWLGGELVDRLGVGVDEGAHVNAPSSLSGRPVRR